MIITKQAGAFGNGLCVWQYDYNDVTLKLTAFRCTNNSAFACRGTLTSTTGEQVSKLVAAGEPWEQAIPTAVANRFALRVDARGRLDGLDKNFEFPAVV